jgi:exonuclease VII large subunit
MTTENNAFETSVLKSIEKLNVSVNDLKGSMDNRFADMDKRFSNVESHLNTQIAGMEDRMEQRFEKMESDLSTKIDDGIEKHANTVRYIKNHLSSVNEGFRPRPHSQLSVIPRSISSYTVQKVPVEPWDPPGTVSG